MEPLIRFGPVEITTLEITIILALFLCALALTWALVRRRHPSSEQQAHYAELQDALREVREAQADMQGRFSQIAESQITAHTTLRQTLDERLDHVSKRVGDSLTLSGERSHEILQRMHERLALIDRAREQMDVLGGQVSDLKNIFSSHRHRGAFGEMQMQDLLRTYLPPGAYDIQKTLSNGRRVDALIHLPDQEEGLAVDAKFPLESYRAFVKEGDENPQIPAGRSFRDDVARHVRDIAERYLLPGETLEPALMFLPSEAIYVELHTRFTQLVEDSFRKKVVIVSPSTFMASLVTIGALLKNAHIRGQAEKIQKELHLLLKDVSRLDERAGKLQRHFTQLEDDVRLIRLSSEKITRRTENFERLDIGELPEGEGRRKEV